MFLTFSTTEGPIGVNAHDIVRWREIRHGQHTKVWLRGEVDPVHVLETHEAIVAALQTHYCVESVLKGPTEVVATTVGVDPALPEGDRSVTIEITSFEGKRIGGWRTHEDGTHTPA